MEKVKQISLGAGLERKYKGNRKEIERKQKGIRKKRKERKEGKQAEGRTKKM